MIKEAYKTRIKYNRNSRFYNLMEFPAEILKYNQWREKLFKEVEGSSVLEVGVGTGKNLKYYTDNYSGFGIDLSEGMLSKAKARAKKKGINLIQMDAQSLGFKDNTFDAVLATFVFCSVPNPVLGLQEIKRVLKPGGRALFIARPLNKTYDSMKNSTDIKKGTDEPSFLN